MGNQVVVIGAGLSSEYGLPTLASAFDDLGHFNWKRPTIANACRQVLVTNGLRLWDCWSKSYQGLDLEKTFSLAWFQASVGVESKYLRHKELIQLFEPTLWHWFQEILRPRFRYQPGQPETGYQGIADRILHLNATKFSNGTPTNYDPRNTIFVNLNWDPTLELELLRRGIAIRYSPPPGARRLQVHPELQPLKDPTGYCAIVLKPHGSLNWYYKKTQAGYRIDFGHPESDWLARSCSQACYLAGREVAVVPPLPIKLRSLAYPKGRGGLPTTSLQKADQDLFPAIWKSIHASIRTSPLLKIIGYSFPPADMLFSLHLANALQAYRLAERRLLVYTPKKSPRRASEYEERVYEAMLEDPTTWSRTEIQWA